MERIDVRLPLPATGNRQQSVFLHLLNGSCNGRLRSTKLLSHAHLTRIDALIVPGIGEELGINDFGSKGEFCMVQDTIGNLGKATSGNRIKPGQDDVLMVLEMTDMGQLFHRYTQADTRDTVIPRYHGVIRSKRALPVRVRCIPLAPDNPA